MFRVNVCVYLARFCVLNFWALVCGNCDSPFSSLPFQKPIYLLKVSFVILSFSNELFGVVSSFSTALYVPSGFSDKRLETAPDLSFPKHVKLVLAKQ